MKESDLHRLERVESALLLLVRIAEHQERVLARIEKALEHRTYPAPVGVRVTSLPPSSAASHGHHEILVTLP